MGLLDQKVALVTGSSSGIGKAIVQEFAHEGASVVVHYGHNREAAEQVKQEIESNNGHCLLLQADLSDPQQAVQLVKQTVEHYGTLDILVNNAGMEEHGTILDVTEEQFERVLSVNLKGPFFCAQTAAQEMVKRKVAGRIINISSVHEDIPMPGNMAYCCAKGGLRMMMRNACLELAPYNITINNIAPGAIRTPINEKTMNDPNLYNQLISEIPLKRMGEPDEVAKLALYLASDASAYVTGSTFFIDGGLTRYTKGL
ncbi:SDR family NAD(P)-dependent oxidoreductase [Thermosporothrix hazakensis]|uniref:Glucose-1-dehydrogenase n=1 Tax=Thermosporothrix sp. COM3 TaxID=2490863 RepID=A0A455SBU1_9CHLR|nr:glucose 1-dehydrogenase [Thermosporothrix hazakensis]BBH85927.1 glucose-1-dehydrogenase [Thermosporothrix sp. COM3]GCE45646.1 glucose-1-dehydrogenase [Thermosporothrix hazakensis]